MLTAKSGRQTILSIGSGDLLAWSAVIGDRVMTATAITLEPTKVVMIHAAQLLDLLERRSDLGFQVMRALARALSRRLLATRLQLLDLYHR
jgi:CRP-like cAMP-binding protein